MNQEDPSSFKNRQFMSYFLLFAIGLIIFFAIAFTFSFKEKVFNAFFHKPFSFAQEGDDAPEVSLMVKVDNSFKKGAVNVEAGKSNLILKWEAKNDPKVCLGRFWSNVRDSDQWSGYKDVKGGEYTVAVGLQKGIYVYSINCSNEFGDSYGSNVVVNVGAKHTELVPHIISFEALGQKGDRYSLKDANTINKGEKVQFVWSVTNTGTPYSICLSDGSWPGVYLNANRSQVQESFTLDKQKIYKYTLFCSNENGYDAQTMSFIAK